MSSRLLLSIVANECRKVWNPIRFVMPARCAAGRTCLRKTFSGQSGCVPFLSTLAKHRYVDLFHSMSQTRYMGNQSPQPLSVSSQPELSRVRLFLNIMRDNGLKSASYRCKRLRTEQSTSLLVYRSLYCWGNDSHPPPSALYKAIRFVVTAVWLCAKRSSFP